MSEPTSQHCNGAAHQPKQAGMVAPLAFGAPSVLEGNCALANLQRIEDALAEIDARTSRNRSELSLKQAAEAA